MEAVSALARIDSPADLASDLAAFHDASFGWALACCRHDRQEAEEVLQAAYLKALDGRARFGGGSSVRTWFFGVVRVTALERRRRHAGYHLALLRWVVERPPEAGGVGSPERLSGEAEMRERLRLLLARLSARQREVLHLVFYQELTLEEAARVLGVSVGSARRHYDRGKARLRRMLSGAGEA